MGGKRIVGSERSEKDFLNRKVRKKQGLENLKKNKQDALKKVKKRSRKRKSNKAKLRNINQVKRDKHIMAALECSISSLNEQINSIHTEIKDEEKHERERGKEFLDTEIEIWKKEKAHEVSEVISIKKKEEKTIDETSVLQLNMLFSNYFGNPVVSRIKEEAEKEVILLIKYEEALANEKSFFYNMWKLWHIFSPKESEKIYKKIHAETEAHLCEEPKSKLEKLLEKIASLHKKNLVKSKFKQDFNKTDEIEATKIDPIEQEETSHIDDEKREQQKNEDGGANDIITLVMKSAREAAANRGEWQKNNGKPEQKNQDGANYIKTLVMKSARESAAATKKSDTVSEKLPANIAQRQKKNNSKRKERQASIVSAGSC